MDTLAVRPETVDPLRRLRDHIAALAGVDLAGYVRAGLYDALHLWRTRARPPAAAIADTSIDLVTVVFGAELDLLALQARSFDRFLDAGFGGRIFVIVNDLRCRRLARRIERNVRPLYGRWRDRVTIVPFHRLGHRLDPSNGWVAQQALKLACARLVTQRHYVVFDAKNHLVAPTPLSRFVDADGVALQTLEANAGHLPRHQAACARYFGIDPHDRTKEVFVPMTPFVLHTQSVRDLVEHVEAREARRFSSFFCGRRYMSEFLLYGAYLDAHGGINGLYRTAPCWTVTVWPGGDTGAALAEAEDSGVFCFGVHRDHLARGKAAGTDLLDGFWQRLGLLRPGETLAGLGGDRGQARDALGRWASGAMIAAAAAAISAASILKAFPVAPVIGLAGMGVALGAAAVKTRGGRLADACLATASLATAAALACGLGLAFQKDTHVEGEGGLIAHGGPLGWTLRPGAHRVVKTVNGRTIYDVTYSIGRDGHRTTEAAPGGDAVAFLGDSFTLGEGLPDADTLPQAFADLTGRRRRVVNLGVSAYSPAQVLRELQLGLYDDVLKPAKVFFLLTAPWHVDRVACLDDWVAGAPRYRIRDLGLVLDGQCPAPAEPSATSRLWHETPVYRALFAGKLPFVGADDIATYVRVVIETAKIAKAKYGVPLEVLYLRNAGYLRFTGMSDDEIVLRMRAGGVDVLEMTLPHEGKAGYAIPGDGHPNGTGNRLRARMLVDALRSSRPDLLD